MDMAERIYEKGPFISQLHAGTARKNIVENKQAFWDTKYDSARKASPVESETAGATSRPLQELHGTREAPSATQQDVPRYVVCTEDQREEAAKPE
jgi:hypothetical protein